MLCDFAAKKNSNERNFCLYRKKKIPLKETKTLEPLNLPGWVSWVTQNPFHNVAEQSTVTGDFSSPPVPLTTQNLEFAFNRFTRENGHQNKFPQPSTALQNSIRKFWHCINLRYQLWQTYTFNDDHIGISERNRHSKLVKNTRNNYLAAYGFVIFFLFSIKYFQPLSFFENGSFLGR